MGTKTFWEQGTKCTALMELWDSVKYYFAEFSHCLPADPTLYQESCQTMSISPADHRAALYPISPPSQAKLCILNQIAPRPANTAHLDLVTLTFCVCVLCAHLGIPNPCWPPRAPIMVTPDAIRISSTTFPPCFPQTTCQVLHKYHPYFYPMN